MASRARSIRLLVSSVALLIATHPITSTRRSTSRPGPSWARPCEDLRGGGRVRLGAAVCPRSVSERASIGDCGPLTRAPVGRVSGQVTPEIGDILKSPGHDLLARALPTDPVSPASCRLGLAATAAVIRVEVAVLPVATRFIWARIVSNRLLGAKSSQK